MQYQPRTIAKDLIARINVAREKEIFSEQDLTSFEDEAYRLRSADIAEGDMVLGIIASYRGDARETHKRFKNALAINGETQAIIHNYGMALYISGDYSGAIQILSPVMECDREAAYIVGRACMLLGLEGRAKSIFDKLEIKDIQEEHKGEALTRLAFISSAVGAVKHSFEEDPGIWQSLSKR